MPLAIGNQPAETAIIWDLHHRQADAQRHCLQDRRTANILRGDENVARTYGDRKTGLLWILFHRHKILQILEKVEGARDRAAAGELCLAPSTAFLIWRPTGGRMHVTDKSCDQPIQHS